MFSTVIFALGSGASADRLVLKGPTDKNAMRRLRTSVCTLRHLRSDRNRR